MLQSVSTRIFLFCVVAGVTSFGLTVVDAGEGAATDVVQKDSAAGPAVHYSLETESKDEVGFWSVYDTLTSRHDDKEKQVLRTEPHTLYFQGQSYIF